MLINSINKLAKRPGTAHTFSLCLGGRDKGISDFEASLVYKASSRTAGATQRNFSRKNKKAKTNPKQKIALILAKLGSWGWGGGGYA